MLLGQGSEQDSKAIKLATKKGTWIPNERAPERARESMQAAELATRLSGTSVRRTRSLSGTYNCVGLVFAARRTCIDADQLDSILEEDGYRRLAGPPEVEVGDVIVYRGRPQTVARHVGIIVEVHRDLVSCQFSFMVLSQWGRDGEYFHRETEVPLLYGTHREYYSERVGTI